MSTDGDYDTSHDRERESDLAVLDANEYKQKRRLERLLDARDNVQETADRAWEQFVRGEVSHDAKNIMIQRAVQSFIKEAHKLLKDHAESVDEADAYWKGDASDPLGVVEQDWGDNIVIPGLRAFRQTQHIYTEEQSRRVSRPNMPPQQVRETQDHTVPEEISERAFLTVVDFLDDIHDMDISFEDLDDSTDTWGFNEVDPDNGTDMEVL